MYLGSSLIFGSVINTIYIVTLLLFNNHVKISRLMLKKNKIELYSNFIFDSCDILGFFSVPQQVLDLLFCCTVQNRGNGVVAEN
jgi:hypothetical protein